MTAPPAVSRTYDPVLLAAWQEGVEEFNGGRYWEAHERWERGWKSLPEPERSWVQGWIQLAGVLYLIDKGRKPAARALSGRALAKLAQASTMKSVLPRLEVEGGLEFLQQDLDNPPGLPMKAILLPGKRM